jgi:hypothetical protein
VFERKSHQAEDPREAENAENLDEDQKLTLTSIVTLADSSKNRNTVALSDQFGMSKIFIFIEKQ